MKNDFTSVARRVSNKLCLTVGQRRQLHAYYRGPQTCEVFDSLPELVRAAIAEVDDIGTMIQADERLVRYM